MHRLSYCFKMVFTADDNQLINSLRQLKVYSSRRFLREFLQKIRRAEDLTACFRTLANIGLRKEFKQGACAHCMYVWQHGLKVDTINVKQVTILNDFVDSR